MPSVVCRLLSTWPHGKNAWASIREEVVDEGSMPGKGLLAAVAEGLLAAVAEGLLAAVADG